MRPNVLSGDHHDGGCPQKKWPKDLRVLLIRSCSSTPPWNKQGWRKKRSSGIISTKLDTKKMKMSFILVSPQSTSVLGMSHQKNMMTRTLEPLSARPSIVHHRPSSCFLHRSLGRPSSLPTPPPLPPLLPACAPAHPWDNLWTPATTLNVTTPFSLR